MLLIEIAHPEDTLDDNDHQVLSNSIVDLFLAPDGHAEETDQRARTTTHIAFRELRNWRTGHGTPPKDAAPPMILTVTVPEAWRAEAGRTFIGLLRTAVQRLDTARDWKRERGTLWVRVDGVPDGDIGLDGRPATSEDVLDFLTEDFRAAQASGTTTPAPEGKLIDPVCGMTVADRGNAVTIVHNGVRLGFCAHGCRNSYAQRHGIPVPGDDPRSATTPRSSRSSTNTPS
ncbi:hypothetical protein [Prauserella cavernicola]|uniref:TRASH domain-containing protein n=1 Tax=Prauserella cavernicola TaxID=2800127 RepID=A0A934QVT2_9PSEU|nr:hypothetical protein [Prauserella cavernicola]MBK1787127.1 hypothetical protein [Prauserella cavernicola]